MAARPWVTPAEIRAYTSYTEVTERSDEQLQFDISRAEVKVITKTNNQFPDDLYPEIPEPVKMAVMLLAEAYAKNAVETAKKNIKSETFDDYSYTVESATIDIDSLDLDDLLAAYVLTTGRGTAVIRMRKL